MKKLIALLLTLALVCASVSALALTFDYQYTVEAQGFGSIVKVTVTLNGDGTIAALTVDAYGETPSLGQSCMDEAFTGQFIGKKGPFTLGDGIDGVTTATITSTAVVDAVNSLYR